MQKQEIFEVLKSALIELFEIDEAKIKPESKIYHDLEIDSIDAIDLLDFIRKKQAIVWKPQILKKSKPCKI